MGVVVRYQPTGMTRQQYDEVTRRLEAGWPPDGLQMHVLFGADGDLRVSEIWESEDLYRSFSEHLLPILQEVGVRLGGEPEIFEVHELELPRTTA